MQRFTGSVEELASVDVSGMADWISAIPFDDWPQQLDARDNHRGPDGQLMPAMVQDLGWHGFGAISDPIVAALSASAYQRMISVVMPGHSIPPHKDQQAPYWLWRVHVPLMTNPHSRFIVGGLEHHLEVGKAYKVNTLAEHAVTNDGVTPRVHLMWDVRV